MSTRPWRQEDVPLIVALCPPFFVLFFQNSDLSVFDRLIPLALALAVSVGAALLLRRRRLSILEGGFVPFAMLFVLLVPGSVPWVGAVLVLAFGWVFAVEIFSGKALLPPILVALAFAIFAFPGGTYETTGILSRDLDWIGALACLPGGLWLLWRRDLSWQVVAGAAIGVGIIALVMADPSMPPWWHHYFLGTFLICILFLGTASTCAPRTTAGRWAYGLLAGGLVVLIRLANPDQPDGVIFALLFAGLFAPLLDRLSRRRVQHG